MVCQRCPVCDGRGAVPAGFYSAVGVPYWSTSSAVPDTCKACGGSGIVWHEPAPSVGHIPQQAQPCHAEAAQQAGALNVVLNAAATT